MVAHLTTFHGKREESPSIVGHKTPSTFVQQDLKKDKIKIESYLTSMAAHLTSVHGVTADLITNPEITKQCVNQDDESTTEQSLPHTDDIEKSADRKADLRQLSILIVTQSE